MHTNMVPTLSPSFSVIAERFRRAGQASQAVALCREGLAMYPDHLSARVTLGCSLLELGQDGEAHRELQAVLKRAPDNLAAIRGLAELHARNLEEHEGDSFELTMPEFSAPVVELSPDPITPVEPAPMLVVAMEPELVPVFETITTPVVESLAEPLMFEIEDVIAAADDDRSLDFDFEFLDAASREPAATAQPVATEQPLTAAPASVSTEAPLPSPVPVPPVHEGAAAVLDEWLTRVRARRAELLSQYAAG